MRKIILFISFAVFALFSYAQEENPSINISFDNNERIKEFDGFLLDVPLFIPKKLPDFSLENYNPYHSTKFQFIDSKLTIYNISTMQFGSYNSYMNGFFFSPQNMLMSSFKLTDNIQLNTYGQYTLDGKKLPNTTGYPWNKKNFTGGAELKFNKNFGIRVDVKYSNDPMFPY